MLKDMLWFKSVCKTIKIDKEELKKDIKDRIPTKNIKLLKENIFRVTNDIWNKIYNKYKK